MPNNPCEPNPEYIFGQCVEEKIMRNVGCQPPWRRFTVEELPECDNLALLNKYANEYERIASMVRNEILEDTRCLIPCTFMEYKVCKYFLAAKAAL